MNLVAVVLNAKTSEDRFDTAKYLLDYGFANYKLFKPEIDSDKITSVKIINGIEKSIVPVYSEGTAIVVENTNAEYTCEYKLNESAQAPVSKGDVLGVINVSNGKDVVATIDLVSPKNVDTISMKYVFNSILLNI